MSLAHNASFARGGRLDRRRKFWSGLLYSSLSAIGVAAALAGVAAFALHRSTLATVSKSAQTRPFAIGKPDADLEAVRAEPRLASPTSSLAVPSPLPSPVRAQSAQAGAPPPAPAPLASATATSGPPVSATPGPSVSATPGPSVSATPGPTVSASLSAGEAAGPSARVSPVGQIRATKKAALEAGSASVYLGAPESEGAARASLSSLQRKYADALGGRRLTFHRVKANAGFAYRIRVGRLSQEAAAALCSRLTSQGEACDVASN